ncbi:MAG: hypothetical protein NXI18_01660 [Alphaproteobacteria bacterium]|nr:hypothetical protein [Alphaproteobacteria bacterium]
MNARTHPFSRFGHLFADPLEGGVDRIHIVDRRRWADTPAGA